MSYEKCTSELNLMQQSETLNEKINELSLQKRDVEGISRVSYKIIPKDSLRHNPYRPRTLAVPDPQKTPEKRNN